MVERVERGGWEGGEDIKIELGDGRGEQGGLGVVETRKRHHKVRGTGTRMCHRPSGGAGHSVVFGCLCQGAPGIEPEAAIEKSLLANAPKSVLYIHKCHQIKKCVPSSLLQMLRRVRTLSNDAMH
jgi:hypothetical protein